jgi:hypothetical protein
MDPQPVRRTKVDGLLADAAGIDLLPIGGPAALLWGDPLRPEFGKVLEFFRYRQGVYR